MLGKEICISFPIKRIISLVPSQTELLYDLGLDEEVIGITKFCVHPEEWFRNKTRIGGTKQLNIEKIQSLKPDLIIANKEENEKEQIEILEKYFPVWTSDIKNVDDALRMIHSVGMLVNKEEDVERISQTIISRFGKLQKTALPKRVAYFIWYKPWMSVGGDTFINDIIERIGWENVLKDRLRYPEITLEELADYNPELILLSSEPFPFKEKHIAEVKKILPNAEVKLVDGEMFSWYGSRMMKAVDYFKELIRGSAS